ncbi:MAG: peptidoglycan-binding domain-containing protein [Candidatus Pacebacteria bacterium]|nr:peptidoglycan-binding domain-containing protein [Candidatus Paceibacterota bacterium]
MSKLTTKISIAAISAMTVLSLSGAIVPVANAALTEAQITSILSLLSTFGADASTVSNVNASLRGQATSGTTTTTTATGSAISSVLANSGSLTVGSRGEAVKALQQYLNANGAVVSTSGAGSVGNESTYFGNATKAALAKWQAAHQVSPSVGYFGSVTKAKMVSLAGGTTTTTTTSTGTTTTTTTGGALSVSLAADQPASNVAPGGAARIPFTKIVLTAGSSAVTVNSITVERTGLSADAALASVVLLDEVGNQIGLTKTLNSDHRANVGEDFTIAAGTSRTLTIAGTRAAQNTGTTGYANQTISLTVVAINTANSATVGGTLPMIGTTRTINESLAIGSVTTARGSLDPGSSQTKEVGVTGYTFSSIKVTAGSAEKVYMKSIRWNQTGSVGSGDLANVKTYVDGTAYDATVSADGKYYTTTFSGEGLLTDKGAYKEISIKGDIIGGSGRTIDFDIAKRVDLNVVGELYGYGITPPVGTGVTADAAAFRTTDDPWYDAAEVLVSTGSMTVSTYTGVQAANVALNLADQPLGGWTVDVKGEPISVASMVFNLGITDADSGSEAHVTNIDNIKLVNAAGTVLAGPKDVAAVSDYSIRSGTVTFTDTITFPVGMTYLTMKGKLSVDSATDAFENNDTVRASTTPQTDWTAATGQTTGKAITISPNSAISGNIMTVKAATTTLSVSSVPIAQTIIAGSKAFEFARIIVDTSSSGEDIRFTSLPLEYNGTTATSLTNCQLYDGTTSLTTSSNIKNPTARASATSFTFDGTGLVVTKGSSKQLSVKCDLSASDTSGIFQWGLDAAQTYSATGLTSGQSAGFTVVSSVGQAMTSSAGGTMTVALDSGSPSYKLVAPGQTVELSRLRLTATNEDIALKQIGLQLTDTASNSPIDLVDQKITIWDVTSGTAVQIGEATISASGTYADFATSSAISNLTIAKGGYKVIALKGTINSMSSTGNLTSSGHLLKVDYDAGNRGETGIYGTGVSSGTTISPTAETDSASKGVRIVKAYPSFSTASLPTSNPRLSAGNTDGVKLYRFKVTANNGDVALNKFTFSVSSSSLMATTTKYALYQFDSAFGSVDDSFAANGLLNAGPCNNGLYQATTTAIVPGQIYPAPSVIEIYMDKTGCSAGTTTLVIPAGVTKGFELRATVNSVESGTTSTDQITVDLLGDAYFPVIMQGGMAGIMMSSSTIFNDTASVQDQANNNFVWSPISTTSESGVGDQDFTNGYGVTGLDPSGMGSVSLNSPS